MDKPIKEKSINYFSSPFPRSEDRYCIRALLDASKIGCAYIPRDYKFIGREVHDVGFVGT